MLVINTTLEYIVLTISSISLIVGVWVLWMTYPPKNLNNWNTYDVQVMTIISLTCLVQVSCIIDSILALVDAGGWNFTSISSASTATAMMSLSCIFKYFTVHIFILCVLIQARLHVFMFLKLYPFGLVSSPSSSFQSSSMLILYTNIIIPFMAVATMIVYLLTDTIHPEIFNKDPIHLRFIVTILFATTCILPTFYLQRLIVLKVLEHFHAKKVTFHASRASYYNNNNNKQQQRHPNIVKSSSLATSRKQHGGDGEDSSNEYDEGNGGSSGSSGIHMRRPGDYARQMDLVVCGPITFTGTLSLVNSNNNNNNSNINNNQLPIIPSYDSLDSILDTTSTTVAAYSPAIPMKKMKLARSSISSFAGKSSSPPPPPPHSTSKALPAVTRFSGGVDSTISSEGRRFYVAQQQKLAHWKSQRTNSIERRVHATVISVFALGSLSLVMTAVGEFWTPHLLTGILKIQLGLVGFLCYLSANFSNIAFAGLNEIKTVQQRQAMLTSAAVQSSGVTPSELAAEGGGRGIVLSEIPDVSMGMNIINDVCDDDDDFQRRNWSNDTNITSESFYAQTSDLQQHQQSRGTTYSYVSGGASSSQLGGGGGGGPLLRAVGPFGSGSFVASNYLDRMGTSSTATTTNINNHPNTSSRKMNGFKGHRYTLSNGSIPVSQYRHLPLPQNQSGTDLSQQNFKDIMVRDITVKDKGGTQNRPR